MNLQRPIRRPARIRFLKPTSDAQTLLNLALKSCVVEHDEGDGKLTTRIPHYDEVKAALELYFGATNSKEEAEDKQDSNVLRVKEAARRLGLSKSTVRLWMRQGRLKVIRLSPGAVGILASEVEAFINKSRI